MTNATARRGSIAVSPLAAAGLLLALAALFWATGTLFPTQLPHYASTAQQVTGMALMLILVPPYMVAAISISRRRSLELIEQLRSALPDPAEADAALERVGGALRRSWKIGSAAGLGFGLLNTNPLDAFVGSQAPLVAGTLSLGQMLLWWLIGLLLSARVVSALAFRRLGDCVSFELFQLEQLRPLARAGVIDVVIIAGALLFSPLQSIDAEFRWYNYRFGLLVGLPAAAFFMTYPLLGIHRRIQRDRDARIAAVEQQLSAGPPDGADSTVHTELLLAHRDRLRGARTWPLSSRLLSRAVFYLVIPPLAWAGAALVERLLEPLLRG